MERKKVWRTAFLLYLYLLGCDMHAAQANKSGLWGRTKSYASGVKERVTNRLKTIAYVSSGDQKKIEELLKELIKTSDQINDQLLDSVENCNTHYLLQQKESLSKNIRALFQKLRILDSRSADQLLEDRLVYFYRLQRELYYEYKLLQLVFGSQGIVNYLINNFNDKNKILKALKFFLNKNNENKDAVTLEQFNEFLGSYNDPNSVRSSEQQKLIDAAMLDQLKQEYGKKIRLFQLIKEGIEKDTIKIEDLKKNKEALTKQYEQSKKNTDLLKKLIDFLYEESLSEEIFESKTPLKDLLVNSAVSLAKSKEVLAVVTAGVCFYSRDSIAKTLATARKSAGAAVSNLARGGAKVASRNVSNYVAKKAQAVVRGTRTVVPQKVVKPVQRSLGRAYTGVTARLPRK